MLMSKKMNSALVMLLLGVASLSAPLWAQSVVVDLNEEHQTIRGFGGMVHNTWQGGAGLSAEDAKIAFGAGEGQLGLTALRIPVNENQSDWGKELAAAKLAQSYGAIVYASPWNPPSNLRDANRYIPENNWQAYVNHLNGFAKYMKDQGAPLYAISIQNEPDWCHEWTCWNADGVYKFIKNYGDKLREHGTKVISAESFAYVKTLYDKILNDASALNNLDIIGAHFYGSTAASGDNFFQYSLADQKATKQERWMTEHYTESQGSGNMWRGFITTGDQDQQAKLDTVRALDVGYEIHRGLVVGNFNQYTWWYIRRCYGLIMERDMGNKISIPQNEIGKVSKRGYVLSQYARFVRPGAIRVGATAKPMNQVFASAYKKEDSVIVVLINRDRLATKTLEISVPGASSITTWTKYTTSETKNVKNDGEVTATNGKFSVTLDKESIMTLVGAAGSKLHFVTSADISLEQGVTQVAKLEAKTKTEGATVSYAILGGTNKDLFDLKGSDLSFKEAPTYNASGSNKYAVSIKATAGDEADTLDLTVTILKPQAPYKGTAWAIPGKIEAENYDVGSDENPSYSDLGGADEEVADYRDDQIAVIKSIEGEEAGYVVGHTRVGEWLEYTVDVKTEGAYTLTARIATSNETSSFRLFIGDEPITDTVKVKNTGSYTTYGEVTAKTAKLSKGTHIIRLEVTGDYFDIDWLNFGMEGASAIGASPLYNVSGAMQYRVYDLKGTYMGTLSASDFASLNPGAYIVRSTDGRVSKLIGIKK